jgi:hypothetical protein
VPDTGESMGMRIHQLFMDFEKAFDLVKKQVLYNIHTDCNIPMKLFRVIKTCLSENHSKICTSNICWVHF